MKLTQKDYDGWSNKMKKISTKDLLEEFGGLYQDYLAECDAYDGASLWSNKRAKKILESIENKLIRDNKRITKWRGLARYWKKEAQFQGAWADIFRDSMTKNMKLCNVANLKQKKAWIAFYIAIILYILSIMGIIILI